MAQLLQIQITELVVEETMSADEMIECLGAAEPARRSPP
jgi:hypothetical protein